MGSELGVGQSEVAQTGEQKLCWEEEPTEGDPGLGQARKLRREGRNGPEEGM
jgi:hypothetical protein